MIAASPRNPRHIICKRVLGLEGDVIRVPVTSRDDARTVKASASMSILSYAPALNAAATQPYVTLAQSCIQACGCASRSFVVLERTVVNKSTTLTCSAVRASAKVFCRVE